MYQGKILFFHHLVYKIMFYLLYILPLEYLLSPHEVFFNASLIAFSATSFSRFNCLFGFNSLFNSGVSLDILKLFIILFTVYHNSEDLAIMPL